MSRSLPRQALVVLALAAPTLAAACADAVEPAFSVDGEEVSHEELEEELELVAEVPGVAALYGIQGSVRGVGQGTFDQQAVSAVIQTQMLFTAIENELERRDQSPEPETIEAARQQLRQQAGLETDVLAERYARDLANLDLLRRIAQTLSPAEQAELSEDLFSDVDVDPRYGQVDEDSAGTIVVPPPGPLVPTTVPFEL